MCQQGLGSRWLCQQPVQVEPRSRLWWPDWFPQGRVKHCQGSPHSAPLQFQDSLLLLWQKIFKYLFFFSWYMFRYLPFSWQRNLEKISLFFFFNKQSYISKWKSISSKKVEFFFLWKCYNRVFDSKNFFFVKTKLPLEMLFYWIDMFWPKKNNIGRGVEKSVTCCSLFAPQWLRLGSKILCFN